MIIKTLNIIFIWIFRRISCVKGKKIENLIGKNRRLLLSVGWVDLVVTWEVSSPLFQCIRFENSQVILASRGRSCTFSPPNEEKKLILSCSLLMVKPCNCWIKFRIHELSKVCFFWFHNFQGKKNREERGKVGKRKGNLGGRKLGEELVTLMWWCKQQPHPSEHSRKQKENRKQTKKVLG